jgi:hypothetical protein
MPDWKSLVRARVAPLPLDPAREADIVDELTQHVAQDYAERVANGATEADALVSGARAARRSRPRRGDIARRSCPTGRADPPAVGAPLCRSRA